MRAAIVLGLIELVLFGALGFWMVLQRHESTLRVMRPVDGLLESRREHAPGIRPRPCARRRARLLLQGIRARDSRVRRLRGCGAAGRGGDETRAGRCRARSSARPLQSGSSSSSGRTRWWSASASAGFTESALAVGNQWVELGDVYWGAGWTLIFVAIVNSLVGALNAVVNAAGARRLLARPQRRDSTRARANAPVASDAPRGDRGDRRARDRRGAPAGWKWDLLVGLGVAAVASPCR